MSASGQVIVLRMRSGRKIKAARGGYARHRTPAFGQRSADGELVSDDRETAVISHMRELRETGMSYQRIADQLNAEGLTAKRGGLWHSMTVSRVLQRPPGHLTRWEGTVTRLARLHVQ